MIKGSNMRELKEAAQRLIEAHGTKKVRAMAAVSRLHPQSTRDSKGRLLPLRYRVAEKALDAGLVR
jgi:hypothetical protein